MGLFIIHLFELCPAGSYITSRQAGVTSVVWELNKRFPELQILSRPEEPALILGCCSAWVSITYFSTFFATQRYLNLNTNAIY